MITPFQIYLWGIADKALGMSLCVVIISATALMLVFMTSAATFNTDPDAESVGKHLKGAVKPLVVIIAISGLCATAIPDSRTIAAMLVLPAIAESEVIKKDLPEIYSMAVERLKESLK